MKPIEVEHYPFRMDESEFVVENAVFGQMRKLLDEPVFESRDKESTLQWLQKHFLRARFMFLDEEELRKKGSGQGDLFYHGKEHSVFQTTYDAITVIRAVLSRKDRFSSHLTYDGVVATVIASMYHDTGFVDMPYSGASYAKNSSIHVDESIKVAVKSLDMWEIPKGLDNERLRNFIVIGIHGTYFPYGEKEATEGRKLLNELHPRDRKEAQIVRLAVQFADLGGQTARIDQNPEGRIRLREEMNRIRFGLGTKLIGADHELDEKRREFVDFVVEKTVGKTGNAFFGTRDHSFSREWHKTSVSSR
ncbi:MAG: hypothetical protein M1444_00585 [Patescibacteria group bacterium]|nr:hypothetical protein [Patescibacteria group bacterium]